MILKLLSLYQIQKDCVIFVIFMLNNSLAASNPKDCNFNTSLTASDAKVFSSNLLEKTWLSPQNILGYIIKH